MATMQTLTSSPAATCLAIVAPAPRTSSSMCAAMTRTFAIDSLCRLRGGRRRRFRGRREIGLDVFVHSDRNAAVAELDLYFLGHGAVGANTAGGIVEIAELIERLAQLAEGLVVPG